KISVLCLGLNLLFAAALVQPYREAGIAVANTLSACINLVLLIYALRKKLSHLGLVELKRSLLVLVPCAVLAGATAALLSLLWEKNLGYSSLPLKIGAVFVPGLVASLLYCLLALWAKIPAAR